MPVMFGFSFRALFLLALNMRTEQNLQIIIEMNCAVLLPLWQKQRLFYVEILWIWRADSRKRAECEHEMNSDKMCHVCVTIRMNFQQNKSKGENFFTELQVIVANLVKYFWKVLTLSIQQGERKGNLLAGCSFEKSYIFTEKGFGPESDRAFLV